MILYRGPPSLVRGGNRAYVDVVSPLLSYQLPSVLSTFTSIQSHPTDIVDYDCSARNVGCGAHP